MGVDGGSVVVMLMGRIGSGGGGLDLGLEEIEALNEGGSGGVLGEEFGVGEPEAFGLRREGSAERGGEIGASEEVVAAGLGEALAGFNFGVFCFNQVKGASGHGVDACELHGEVCGRGQGQVEDFSAERSAGGEESGVSEVDLGKNIGGEGVCGTGALTEEGGELRAPGLLGSEDGKRDLDVGAGEPGPVGVAFGIYADGGIIERLILSDPEAGLIGGEEGAGGGEVRAALEREGKGGVEREFAVGERIRGVGREGPVRGEVGTAQESREGSASLVECEVGSAGIGEGMGLLCGVEAEVEGAEVAGDVKGLGEVSGSGGEFGVLSGERALGVGSAIEDAGAADGGGEGDEGRLDIEFGGIELGVGKAAASGDGEDVHERLDDAGLEVGAASAVGEADAQVEEGIGEEARGDEIGLRNGELLVLDKGIGIAEERDADGVVVGEAVGGKGGDAVGDRGICGESLIPVQRRAEAGGDLRRDFSAGGVERLWRGAAGGEGAHSEGGEKEEGQQSAQAAGHRRKLRKRATGSGAKAVTPSRRDREGRNGGNQPPPSFFWAGAALIISSSLAKYLTGSFLNSATQSAQQNFTMRLPKTATIGLPSWLTAWPETGQSVSV